MIKTFSLVAILLLSTASFAAQVTKATLITGVSMGYSKEKTQLILIGGSDGKTYKAEAKNDSPQTERIQIRLLQQCENKLCSPIKGYVVDTDGIAGVKAKTMISQHAQMYAMSSVVSASITKGFNDSNATFEAKERMVNYYRDLAEQAAPYMMIEAKTPVQLVVE
jgi:hypothetical protein